MNGNSKLWLTMYYVPGIVLSSLNVLLKILTTTFWLQPPFYRWGLEAWIGYTTCQAFTTSQWQSRNSNSSVSDSKVSQLATNSYVLLLTIEWRDKWITEWITGWTQPVTTAILLILTASGTISRSNPLESVMQPGCWRLYCVRQFGTLKKIKPKGSSTSFFIWTGI